MSKINPNEPIVEDGREWRLLAYHELYFADKADAGRIVPNESDMVVHLKERTWWIVSYRNPLWPYDFKLEPFTGPNYSNTDVVTGDRSPMARDAFRVLINKDVVPASLNINSQWYVKGSANSYIRVFLGTRIGEDGVCISGYRKNNVVTDRIPLELSFAGNTSNKTIKNPVPGICTKIPDDGEMVTVVTYNTMDEITDVGVCNVTLTDMAMITNKPQKRIVDIRLKSPHMSPDDNRLLKLPTNVPIDDILVECEIIYTTGSVVKNIDGKKIKLIGLKSSGAYDEMMIASSLGMEIPLMLSYSLSQEESYIGDDIVDNVINRRYKAYTDRINGTYSPKLFVVPIWKGAESGYRLEYYLTDLRRNAVYPATQWVRYAENSPVIDPKLYNIRQQVGVRVNTADVSPEFKPHPHTEVFAITFTSPGVDKRDNFIIEYVKGSPAYGDEMYASFEPYNVTYNRIDIRCGQPSLTEWLDKVYYPIYPVFDRRAEGNRPPQPTHFEIQLGSRSFRYPISEWLNPVTVDCPVSDGDSLRIVWIIETAADDLYLGVSPLLLHENK